MNQIEICAHHESGHVVMRLHHGLTTPMVVVFPDGSGIVAPTGMLIHDLSIQLDITLGGAIAEEIFLNEVEPYDEHRFVDLLWSYGNLGLHDDFFGDYEQAVKILKDRYPEWSDYQIYEAFQASYAKCLEVLSSRWQLVQSLAAEIQSATDMTLHWSQIAKIAEGEELKRGN